MYVNYHIYIFTCLPIAFVRSHALFSTVVRHISGPLQGHSHCISKTCLLANIKRVAFFSQRFCPAYIVFILVATQVSGERHLFRAGSHGAFPTKVTSESVAFYQHTGMQITTTASTPSCKFWAQGPKSSKASCNVKAVVLLKYVLS